jgi:hypothetical protein
MGAFHPPAKLPHLPVWPWLFCATLRRIPNRHLSAESHITILILINHNMRQILDYETPVIRRQAAHLTGQVSCDASSSLITGHETQATPRDNDETHPRSGRSGRPDFRGIGGTTVQIEPELAEFHSVGTALKASARRSMCDETPTRLCWKPAGRSRISHGASPSPAQGSETPMRRPSGERRRPDQAQP